MMHNRLLIIPAMIALGFGSWTIFQSFKTTPNEISLREEPDEITFICTETGETSRGELRSTPALNTRTGRRTLVQALYCRKCQKWQPAPPPVMVERSPRGPTCPLCAAPLAMTISDDAADSL